jgi:hypothetical protein
MRQLIIILILIFSISVSLYSQTDSVYTGDKPAGPKKTKRIQNNEWKKKFTYGGNFQTLFGTVTYIYLTPTIGYIPFKKCNVGVGFIYNYTSINYPGYGRYSQSIFGGHSYARYFFTPNVFGQVQYDRLFQPDWYNAVDPGKKVWVDYGLIGAGYSQPFSERFAFNTSIMYNLTPQKLSIYPSRYIFQVGFNARFN